MLDKENLRTLAKIVAKADPSSKVAYSYNNENLTYSELDETLRAELNELGKDYKAYRRNYGALFELLETIIDDVLPQKVLDQYSQFAEVRQFPQGSKPIFVQKITEASRRRAKQFITRVGLAGVYEVFKLDGREIEVTTSAFGGACQISIEEYLDGRIDMATLLDIVMEALDEIVYREIMNAMATAAEQLQASNVYVGNSFVEAEMDALLAKASAYGTPTIYCTFEFAATMLPQEGWISNEMKNERWQNGYLGNYKGHRVIVLRQSYEDETNTKKVIDPKDAYIFVSSGSSKPILIALEGNTLLKRVENEDWSEEIRVYKKLGVATRFTNDMFVYRNEALQ